MILRSGRLSAVVVLGLAVAGHWWTLGLPFRLDDVVQIPEARAKLADELRVLKLSADREAKPLVPEESRHRFRPALWATFALEASGQAPPFSPRPFYATSLLLHALTAMLLLAGLRQVLPPGGALAGALAFALHPAGSQSLTWIAARADILCGLFAVLSWLAIVRSGRRPELRWPFAAGLALALAIASKDAAYPWAPVLLGLLLWHRRAAPRRLAGVAAFLAPVAAVVVWRHVYLGTWSLTYTAGGAADAKTASAFFGLLPDLVAHLLVPWRRSADVADLDPLLVGGLGRLGAGARAARLIVAGALLAWLAAATLAGRRGAWKPLVPAAFALGLLLAPIVFIFSPENGQAIDRAFYQPKLVLAFLVGAATAAAAGGGAAGAPERRWVRRLARAGLALFVLAGLDALVHVARAERAAGDRLAAEIADIEAAARGLPEDGIAVVTGPPLFFGGAFQLGDQIPWRFRRPFRRETLRVLHFHAAEDMLTSGLLRRENPPLILLRSGADGVRAENPVLPAIPARLPRLERAGGAAVFRPAAPVPPRAVAAVAFFLPMGRTRDVRIAVRVAGGGELAATVPPREGAGAAEEILLLDEKPGLLLASELTEVLIEGLDPVPAGLRPPALLAQAPDVRIEEPPDRYRWRPGLPLRFVVRGPEGAARFRFEFEITVPALSPYRMVYEPPPAVLETLAGGARAWYPLPDHYAGGSDPRIRIETIPELFEDVGRRVGLPDLALAWRVSALSPTGTLLARSRWTRLIYAPL